MVGAKRKKLKKMPHNIGKPLRKVFAPKKAKKLISRRVKMRKIRIVTRKEQPIPLHLKRMKVEALARQDIPLQRVSSSWIKEIGYHAKERLGVFITLTGYGYYISRMPMRVFEGWYYAHSKGTFFNHNIKGKYTITRYR